MKTCTVCNQTLPFEDFHKKKSGYHPSCKTCRNTKNREWNKNTNYKRKRTPVPQFEIGVVKNKHWKNRKKKLRQATPPWVKTLFIEELEYIYFLRRDLETVTGELYDVDHIIPIRHPDVCGLHVPWNLQILPSDINRTKSNTFKSD